MAVQVLLSLYVLAVLFSKSAASHEGSRGLSCVNDFVNNVSCTWDGSTGASGLDCWIVGVKTTWMGSKQATMTRNCKLKQNRNSPSGCSFVFENEEFNPFRVMPYIRVECNGTTVENITNYYPYHHIKRHPPGVPNVSCTANETRISWSPGSSPSPYLKSFTFQVQLKRKKQSWNESSTLYTQERELMVAAWKVKGPQQVRVRGKPILRPTLQASSHWSNWSPTTSWLGGTDMETKTQDEEGLLGLSRVVMLVGIICLGIFIVALVLYRRCASRGLLKGRPVPNPSQYFHTLDSIHGGNVKEWLNPPSAPASFFTALPDDSISPVEMCEGWGKVPTTSASCGSTSARLHFGSGPPVGLHAGGVVYGVVDDPSSSSSFFSNKGYFISSSSGSLAPTGLSPACSAYQDNFHNLRNTLNLRLSLHPSLDGCPTYESLKREPQSPDSGLGTGKEDEDANEDERFAHAGDEGASDEEPSPAPLTLPLRLPPQVWPPSSAPPTPGATVPSESQRVEAAHGHYAAWPLAGAVCRSPSMPMEASKSSYLTLKELQTSAFSNKSI